MAILSIPVVKSKGQTIDLDTKLVVDQAVYQYIFELGAKLLVNRGTSKLIAKDATNEADFIAEAMKIAQEQVAKIYAGDIRRVGASKATGSKKSPEMTEAIRLAKIYAKDQLKAQGIKVSHIAASDITKAATAYVNADHDTWMAAARDSLSRAAVTPTTSIDLKSMVKEDPKRKAASAKKSADAKKEKATAAAGKAPPPKKPAAKKPQATA